MLSQIIQKVNEQLKKVPGSQIMAKPYEFNWRPNVPDRLLKGEPFDRWEEVGFWLIEKLKNKFCF